MLILISYLNSWVFLLLVLLLEIKKLLNNLMNTIYDVCNGKISVSPNKIDYSLTDFSDNNEKIIASILDKAKDVTNKSLFCIQKRL